MLPPALAGLAQYRQFITYKLLPDGNKIPTNWQSGDACDAHDPANWTDYDTAFACGKGYVGFVLTEAAGIWCLDIDKCAQAGGWSPLALELCAALPGCAVEVSVSGQGLHIWGSCVPGKMPSHKCKTNGLELYHRDRFIALGGHAGTLGDVRTIPLNLDEVIARYFTATGEAPPPSAWTEVPVSEWSGPTDDDKLIERARNSRSADAAFGTKASFDDLWEAKFSVLAQAYPSQTGHPYDASSADAALASHLAFWTGKDCARIHRLMLRSKLARDKWERDDYLPRTILASVSACQKVCVDRQLTTTSMATLETKPQDITGETFANPDAQKLLWDGYCYIADMKAIIMPGGFAYGKEQFNDLWGNFTYALDHRNEKVTKNAWEAYNYSKAVLFNKAHTCSFRPDKTPGSLWLEDGQKVFNSFWPVQTPSKQGNALPFKNHMAKILPNERDRAILLAYMAAVVQYQGVKFQWAPLVQGTRGNGKTLLNRCVIAAVGKKLSHSPKAEQIAEKFNDWLENKIFISVDDIYVPHEREEVLELLKPMITSDWQEIRSMNRNKVTRYICANFMLNANKKDAIRMTGDNRGIAIFYTAQQCPEDLVRDGMDGDYFPKLYDWLNHQDGYAIVTDYLQHYKIPDELNPARGAHRAPQTSSTAEAIRESLGSLEQEIQAAILEDRVGFRNGWISSHYLDLLIRGLGAGYRLARNKRTAMLAEMGYIPHPELAQGQTHNVVEPDKCKPRLYITRDHYSIKYKGAAIAHAYTDDQQRTEVARAFGAVG